MPEPGPLTRALISIARDGHDDRQLAGEICRACTQCLDVHGAAISLLPATHSRETLSATDPTAATVEDLQFTMGEGACVEAALSGRAVLVADIHDPALTTRWPMFAAAVAEQTSVRALFALPLQMGTINFGALDLYRFTPGPLRGNELRDVTAAADIALLLLLAVPTHTLAAYADSPSADGQHPPGRLPDQWHADGDGAAHSTAVDGSWSNGRWEGLWNGRAEVHQATGMVLAQLEISAQEAFVRLRAHAFATRRPLADVAGDVVARRLDFSQDMD